MLNYPADGLTELIGWFNELPFWSAESFPTSVFAVRGLLATLVVCFVCGAMGSLVVGNRMAFFSDALAHCAFAGVALGLLLCILADVPGGAAQQLIRFIMVAFGITIGLLIAIVRDQTGLASDTVIGVFYAGAIGVGAVVIKVAQSRQLLNLESFIFGDPTSAQSWEIVLLLALALAAAVFLILLYNWLILASVNPSLAMSRRVPVRMCRYLFVVLLALIINLSQQITGTLLINGLLIVPAATAANLANNLRQMFWYSIGIALVVGFLGNVLSWEVTCLFPNHAPGISGTIICLSVIFFVLSMPLGRVLRRSV